jgi:hypothetical protein
MQCILPSTESCATQPRFSVDYNFMRFNFHCHNFARLSCLRIRSDVRSYVSQRMQHEKAVLKHDLNCRLSAHERQGFVICFLKASKWIRNDYASIIHKPFVVVIYITLLMSYCNLWIFFILMTVLQDLFSTHSADSAVCLLQYLL